MTTATRKYVNPSMMHLTLSDVIGNYSYGELIFLPDESPTLSPEQEKVREEALQDYKNNKDIVHFDSISSELLGNTTSNSTKK